MIKSKICVFSIMLIVVVLMSQQTLGQVIYGSTKDGSGSGTHSAGYLLGHKIEVSDEILLTHVGIIFDQAGGKFRVGIYTDAEDQPEKLLGEIPAHSILRRGLMESFITDPMILSPGNYWVMITVSRDTKISNSPSPSSKICYRPFSFDDSMPNSLGPTTNYMRTHIEDVYLKCEYPKEGICPFSTAPAGEIYFPTIKGKVYQVQFTENFASPNWQPLAPAFTATGAKTNVFVSTRNTPKRRYRVIIK